MQAPIAAAFRSAAGLRQITATPDIESVDDVALHERYPRRASGWIASLWNEAGIFRASLMLKGSLAFFSSQSSFSASLAPHCPGHLEFKQETALSSCR